jgi:hypothetical protein
MFRFTCNLEHAAFMRVACLFHFQVFECSKVGQCPYGKKVSPAFRKRSIFPCLNYMKYSVSPSELVKKFGGSYARELGIDLSQSDSTEIHKWFLAAVLFGARISGEIAANTYAEFARAGVMSSAKIVHAGWNELVRILGRGGYTRYDFKTADKLLQVSNTLLREYAGDLNSFHRLAADESDLERRLKQLGKGVGDVTVNIFLREMRSIWPKAQPLPTARIVQAAKALGLIDIDLYDVPSILKVLKEAAREDGMKPEDFPEFEAALVRFGLASRRKALLEKP